MLVEIHLIDRYKLKKKSLPSAIGNLSNIGSSLLGMPALLA
jgi:hypothetical protein